MAWNRKFCRLSGHQLSRRGSDHACESSKEVWGWERHDACERDYGEFVDKTGGYLHYDREGLCQNTVSFEGAVSVLLDGVDLCKCWVVEGRTTI